MMNFQNCSFESAAALQKQLLPSDLPEIVFSGRSNVGKSSLINKLVNRKALARTSSSPGKTATINFYRVDRCRFVDLPGYGYAKVSFAEKKRWGNLIEGYFSSGRQIQLVVQIVDMRHALSKDDCNMIDYLIANQFPFVVMCTKVDKLNRAQREQQSAYFEELFTDNGYLWLPVSAANGENVELLREIITKHSEI